MDLTNLVKDCVNSVCRSAEFIDLLIIDDTLVVDVADTSLAIINLGFDFKGVRAFRYKEEFLDIYLDGAPPDDIIARKLISYWNEYEKLSISTPIIARCDDLRSIEEYEALLSLKANDGLGWYKMPCDELYQYCFVPVFSGFPTITKPDKVGLVVHRIDYNTLLMEYHIYKKKINRDFVMWFRTIDISQSLIQHKNIMNKR